MEEKRDYGLEAIRKMRQARMAAKEDKKVEATIKPKSNFELLREQQKREKRICTFVIVRTVFPFLWCLLTYLFQEKEILCESVGGTMLLLFIWMDAQILIGQYWIEKRTSKALKGVVEGAKDTFILGTLLKVANLADKFIYILFLRDLVTDSAIYFFALFILYGLL